MTNRSEEPIKIPRNLSVPGAVIQPDSPQTPNADPQPPRKIKNKKTKTAKTKKQTGSAAKKPGSKSLGVMIFHHAITVFILLLLLSIGVWSYLTFSKSNFFVPGNAAATPPAAQSHIITAQLQRINAALETYEVIHERYPARLEELVDSGLLLSSDLYYPLVNKSYNYIRYQQSYDLSITDDILPDFELFSDESDDSAMLDQSDDADQLNQPDDSARLNEPDEPSP